MLARHRWLALGKLNTEIKTISIQKLEQFLPMDPQDSLPENTAGGTNPSQQQSAEQQTPQGQPSQTTETPTVPEVSDAPSQPTQQSDDQQIATDDDLTEWASSQNIDLDNPTPEQARLLAKRLRDTQKAFRERGQNNQKFNTVQKEVSDLVDDGSDSTSAELRALRNQNARRDFWDAHPKDRHLESKMIEHTLKLVDEAKKTGDEALRQGALFYSSPAGWDALLAQIKVGSTEESKDGAFEAGRQFERENSAKRAQASAPAKSATSTKPTGDPNSDEAIGKMSVAEYKEWRKTHNPFHP